MRMFSRLGYDATTVGVIAQAAGVEAAEIREQFGGKNELYIAMMEEITQEELVYLRQVVADFTPDLPGLLRLADSYLDYCIAHPEIPALWMHRWLWDAADITELENRFLGPTASLAVTGMRNVFRDASDHDIDFDFELGAWTIVWCIHCFVQAGLPDETGQIRGPEDPIMLSRFRAHLRQLIERSTGFEH